MAEKEKEEWGETVKVVATDNSDEWGETVVVDPKSTAPSTKGGESGALVRPLTPTSASEGSELESWTQTINPFADKGAVKPTQQAGATQAPKAKLLKVIPSSEKKSPELLKARVDTYGDMYKRAMDRAYTLKQSVEGVDNELKNSKAYVDSNPNDQNAINSYNALISKRNEMAEMARMEIARADAWQKGIEKTQLEIDDSLTASESVSNSISNMATQIKGFLPASGLAISTLQNKVMQGAIYATEKLMGADDETASKVSVLASQNLPSAGILGTTQKEASQFYTERLGELEKEQKPTKSIIKTFEEGDVAGLGAAILDGGSSVLSSVITSAPTGGVGIFTEMMGRSVYDFNNEKAKRLKISVDELYDRGLDEAAVPLAIGAVSASLEKIGLDGISKAINKKIGSKAVKDIFEIVLEGSKEAGTEWLQTGAEEYNKAIARGMNAEQAGEVALSKMLSEEGREAALKGAAGSGVSIATGRAAKSLYGMAKSNRDKLYQDLAKVETLARERANPNLSSEALSSIDREINNTTANMQKEVLDQLNRRANLTEENASLVEGIEANVKTISDDIESKKLLSEDPSLSDDAKIIIDLEIADLEAKRLDLAAQSEEIIKNNRPIELKKNTSPTSDKYGTINRNDGKGVVDLTKEEFEAEQAKMQPKVDEQVTPTAEGEQAPKTKEEIVAEVELKNEGKAEAPTKESVTERLNINNPFYQKVEDALVKLELIEKYNPETGTGDVVGGYAQQTSDGGFSAGKMLFSQDGSISYFDGDVKVSFDKNGNVISENTKEVAEQNKQNEIESKKENIANLEKTRDSEAFKYKEVTETDPLGNRKKVKRLKTEQELKESTDKINAAIDKAKNELTELEKQYEKEPTKKEDGEPMSGGVQGVRPEGQAGKESAELRPEEEEVADPLKDVESTAKALEGVDKKEIEQKVLPNVIDIYKIQDDGAERILERSFKPNRVWVYKIENAGDIIRELSKYKNEFLDPSYIYEKVNKIEKFLKEQQNQLKVSPEDSYFQFKRQNEESVKDFISAYENLPTISEAQSVAKKMVLSLLNGNIDEAQKGIDYFNEIRKADDIKAELQKRNKYQISEAYHKAKAGGSNPELVKAVEELLGKPKEATPQEGSVVGGEIKSNWNYEGEGDAFASNKDSRDGKSAYTIRILDRNGRGSSYNRAKQRGELDTKSPLTYEGDKESISAIDGNGNTVGVIKLQTDGGVEHIVVAPEFSRKGVASELIKQIKQKGAKVNFEKSKLISPDAAKLFNKIRSEQSLQSTPKAEEKVSGGLTQEEKANLENISKDAGVNFQEVRNVYNKYGEGKPLNEITLEDYQKAEEKRQELLTPKQEEDAKKQQSGQMREQGVQDQPQRKGDSDMPIINEAELQDGEAVEEEVTQEELNKQQDKETQVLLNGEAAKRRSAGKFIKDGVEYVRNKVDKGIRGIKGSVKFAEGVPNMPFTYKLVEAETLQPSHSQGVRNQMHFIPEAQPKRRNDEGSVAAEIGFANNPRFNELGENTNAYSGAPIVNERNEVVQGNNRSAGLKIGYDRGNKKYKNDLADNAEKFGFTREQVEGMKNPILVREVAFSDEGAIEYGNYDAKDLETGGKRRIDPLALVKRIPLKEKARLAKLLFSGEGTLNSNIRANSKDVLAILNPFLNQAQRTTLLKDGEITSSGVEDIEALVQQFLFDNGDMALPELFENLPYRQREGIRKSLPFIFSAGVEADVIPEIQNAILALNQFQSTGIENFDTWLNQSDVFADNKTPRDIYTPQELAIARALNEAKTQSEIVEKFKSFSSAVQGTPEIPANLIDEAKPAIEGQSKEEALKQIFNVKENESRQKENLRGGKKVDRQQEAPKQKPKEPTAEEVEEEGLPKLTKEQQIEAERRSLNEPKNVSDLAKIFNKILGLSPKESVMAARLFDVKAKNMSELSGITKDEYYQRYWFTGELSEKGKQLNQIVGENAQLAQDIRDNLQVARDMETAGKDAKTIRLATGWEKGADGKWRYEIADIKNLDKAVFNKSKKETVSLYDLVGDNEIFKAYPELKKIKVKSGKESFFNAADNTIILSDLFTSLSAKSTLIHELQHAIQFIEGFAYGTTGGREMMSARARYNSFIVEKLLKENKEYRDLYIKADTLPYYVSDASLEKNKEREELDNRLQDIFDDYIKKNPIDENKLKEIAKKLYRSNKGEIEARNVETRMGMTPEQRRATTLQETEDVARDEQIVLFGEQEGGLAQVEAYHGSPYKFGKFTTEKIGTGEGAQAFGWGLYFTDLESIAKGYADKLSDINIDRLSIGLLDLVKGGRWVGYDVAKTETEKRLVEHFAIYENEITDAYRQGKDVNKAVLSLLQDFIDDEKQELKSASNKFSTRESDVEYYKNAIKEAERLKGKIIKADIKSSRNLYKATLHKGKIPSNAVLLSHAYFDKPKKGELGFFAAKHTDIGLNDYGDKRIYLIPKKDAKIFNIRTSREYLEKNGLINEPIPNIKIGGKPFTYADHWADEGTLANDGWYYSQKRVLQDLKEKGIEVDIIHYLDEDSTVQEQWQIVNENSVDVFEKQPDQYNWLEWDRPVSEKDIIKINKALEEKGIPATPKKYMEVGYDGRVVAGMKGKQVYSELVKIFGDEYKVEWGKQASLFLLENGIDGIKYPAESISRGATSDTARGFNYVVFDENAVTIEESKMFQDRRGAWSKIAASAKRIISMYDKARLDTAVHEILGHDFLDEIISLSATNKEFEQDLNTIIDEYIKSSGNKTSKATLLNELKNFNVESNNQSVNARAIHEWFSRTAEGYFMGETNIKPDSKLAKMFEQFRQYLTDLFNTMTSRNYIIPSEPMKQIFRKAFGAENFDFVNDYAEANIMEGKLDVLRITENEIPQSRLDKFKKLREAKRGLGQEEDVDIDELVDAARYLSTDPTVNVFSVVDELVSMYPQKEEYIRKHSKTFEKVFVAEGKKVRETARSVYESEVVSPEMKQRAATIEDLFSYTPEKLQEKMEDVESLIADYSIDDLMAFFATNNEIPFKEYPLFLAAMQKRISRAINELNNSNQGQSAAKQKLLNYEMTIMDRYIAEGTATGQRLNYFKVLKNMSTDGKLRFFKRKFKEESGNAVKEFQDLISNLRKERDKAYKDNDYFLEENLSLEQRIEDLEAELAKERSTKAKNDKRKDRESSTSNYKNPPKRKISQSELNEILKNLSSAGLGQSFEDLNDALKLGFYIIQDKKKTIEQFTRDWNKITKQNKTQEELSQVYRDVRKYATENEGVDIDDFDSDAMIQSSIDSFNERASQKKNLAKKELDSDIAKAEKEAKDKDDAPSQLAKAILSNAKKELGLGKKQQDYVKELLGYLKNKAKDYYKTTNKQALVDPFEQLKYAVEMLNDANGRKIWDDSKAELIAKIDSDKDLSQQEKDDLKAYLDDYQNAIFDQLLSKNKLFNNVKKVLAEESPFVKKDGSVDWNGIIIQAKGNVEIAKQIILDSVADKLQGYSGSQVNSVIDAIGREYQRRINEKRAEIIEKQLKDISDKKVIFKKKIATGFVQKLVEMENSGALGDQRFEQALKEWIGFSDMTPDKWSRLRELIVDAEEAPEGNERDRAIENLSAYIKFNKIGKFAEIYSSAYYAGLLARPTTIIKNSTGIIEPLLTLFYKSFTDRNYAKAMLQGLKRGDAADIWGGGLVQGGKLDEEVGNDGLPRVNMLKQWRMQQKGIIPKLFALGAKPLDLLSMADALSQAMVERGAEYEFYARYLLEKNKEDIRNGVQGVTPITEKEARRIAIKRLSDDAMLDWAFAQAEDEFASRKIVPSSARLNRRAYEIVSESLLPTSVRELAQNLALEESYKSKLISFRGMTAQTRAQKRLETNYGVATFLGSFAKGLVDLLGEGGGYVAGATTKVLPVTEARRNQIRNSVERAISMRVLPFARGISNVVEKGLEKTPYGIVSGVVGATAEKLSYGKPKTIDEILQHQYMMNRNKAKIAKSATSMIIGSAIYYTLLSASKEWDDEEEKEERYYLPTGFYSAGETVRFGKNKIERYTLPVNCVVLYGRIIPLSLFGTVGIGSMITAQAYDNFLSKEKKKQGAVVDPDNPESIKGFSSFVSSSGNAILNMSAMQSISELQESVSSKGTMDFGDYASKLSVKSIALPIPFSGTANQIIQGARYLSGDKTAQAAIGADEKIYKELGLAGIVYNRPVLDWRGRPVNAVLQNQEGIASFVSMLDKRPLDKIDMYLLKELEFNPVIDKRLSDNFADLNMVGMSKDEYYDYTKNVGMTANNYIEAYFDKIKDYQIPQDKIDELAAEGKKEADLKKQLKTIKKTFVSDFLNIAEQKHMLNYQFKKGIIKEAYEAKVRANNDRLKNLIEKINDKGE